MARIAGVDIPEDKKIRIALTRVFGIGRSLAEKISKQVQVDPMTKTKELNDNELMKIRNIVEKKYKVEGELRDQIKRNIERLKEINCYRGRRHKEGLPVRGQQTQTNSRTVRGNVRQTVATGQKGGMEKK
jgi:small subunit ribosomal protein S13